MRIVSRAGEILNDEGPLVLCRKGAEFAARKRPISPVLDVLTAKSLSPAGWYELSTPDGHTFECYSEGSGAYQRARMRGTLEPHVMTELARRVSDGMHVWDVGAAWGYFTQAVAAMGASVTAFERRPDRCETVADGAERNGWVDSVEVVEGAVGDEIVLDDYPTPDIVKMDVEGWEYAALETASETLAEGPFWILEIHEPEMCDDAVPARSGASLKALFESHGYSLTELERRGDDNYHVLAESG